MDEMELQFRKSLGIQLQLQEAPEVDDPTGWMAGFTEVLAKAPLPPCAKPPMKPGPPALPPIVNWGKTDPAPKPVPLDPMPSLTAPLPKADVLVVTWTSAEVRALGHVLTPGVNVSPDALTHGQKWYPYARNLPSYQPDLHTRPPWDVHPAIAHGRLGSYFVTQIGDKSVVVFKSELHLNIDGSLAMKQGRPLPLVRMTQQILQEVRPKYFISTGTAGGIVPGHGLGDVVISTAGIFNCNDPKDFQSAPFNCKTFGNEWWPSEVHLPRAEQLMLSITEHPIGPPHEFYPRADLVQCPRTTPRIHPFKDKPIVTTDYFEFGTSTNKLWELGCAVEMDDAMLAMAIEGLPAADRPKYAFVRNVSDPVLNGALHPWLQVMWATFYYQRYGLVTSYNSALTTWAIVAGSP